MAPARIIPPDRVSRLNVASPTPGRGECRPLSLAADRSNAITAVMRKLIVIANTLLNADRLWVKSLT